MRSLWRCLLLVVLAASASACGKGSPAAPTPASNSTAGAAATRVVSLGGSLNFGAVEIGKTSELTLTIGNAGTGSLSVTGITVPGGYTPNWTSGTIAPGASQQVTVRFAPLAAQSYDGLLTVHGDHTAGTNTAPLSGTGAERAPARATLTGTATEQGAGVLGGATIEIRDGPDARTWTTTDEDRALHARRPAAWRCHGAGVEERLHRHRPAHHARGGRRGRAHLRRSENRRARPAGSDAPSANSTANDSDSTANSAASPGDGADGL